MSFNEDRLNSTAQEIVDTFISTGESLTTLVRAKVANAGWNNNQASRLIEKVNGEAFLKVFPGKSEFEVAEPEGVTGIKVASEKQTTVGQKGYRFLVDREPHEIFGVENFKFASSVESTPNYSKLAFLDSVYAEKFADDTRVKLTEQNLIKEASEWTAYREVKEAVLQGKGFNEIEVEACEVFNNRVEKVASIMNAIHTKLSQDTAIDRRLLKRAHVEEIDLHRVNLENSVITALRSVV